MVESHLVEDLGAAVEVSTVIVQRLCAVSQRFERTRCTLHLIEFCICLIRIFARSEETHTHACKDFKLRIRCSGSHRWHFKIPGRIFIKQFP